MDRAGAKAMTEAWRTAILAVAGISLAAVVAPAPAMSLPEGRQQAAPAGEELPDARALIDRYVEAIGGADRLRSFTSRHATGTFEIPGQGLRGEIEIFSAAPDLLKIVVDYEGLGEAITGYDGEIGWSIDPLMGPRILSGSELEQLVDDADFYGDLHAPEDYESVETVERTEFAGHDTYKVRLVTDTGREIYEYFDVDSGLMVGTAGEQESLMGTLNVVSVLTDYAEVDGIRAPHTLTQDFGVGPSAVTTITAIEHVEIAPETFEPPPQIEALR